jgi:hypothetical protein
MVKTCLTLAWLAALGLTAGTAHGVRAATAHSGRPTITITNLHNGTVVDGSTVTVDVSVRNFKLVPPVYLNPPKLTGYQGHIHYVLDSLANFKPRRDATIQLSHSWTGVAPGKHLVTAYLATSQHAQFAAASPAHVTITVQRAAPARPSHASTTPKTHVTHTSAPRTAGAPMVAAPRSGGAEGDPVSPPGSDLMGPGVLALVLGLALLGASSIASRVPGRNR